MTAISILKRTSLYIGGKCMKYVSTRGGNERLDSAEAIIQGLSANGGLFVPTEIPDIDEAFIAGLVPLTYQDRAKAVLGKFLVDYTADEIARCVDAAYGGDKFDMAEVAPVHGIRERDAVLELWHGPTSAFKDMALQLLPQLLSTALRKTGEKSEIVILVATSGDTGKAALEGFKDVDQIKIAVFYPESGVSEIQRRQMITQEGGNVTVLAVKGNFDDAQTGVKKIFNDVQYNEELRACGFKLSSANSINWGRLVPQIVYYFSAYADLVKAGKITLGDKVNFVVPTGNFGNILAGYYAKLMGLPVNKFVCASNANNVLTDFLRTGIYDRNRMFHKTASPSMDILISSNLERLLYHVTGGDDAQIAAWMRELSETGRYDVGEAVLAKIQELFWADYADDEATLTNISRVFEEAHYTMDTHTSVAEYVADAYRTAMGDTDTVNVILSTASPYKFNESVLDALVGKDTLCGMDEFAMLDRLAEVSGLVVPPALASLKTAPIRHTTVCAKEEMPAVVKDFLK